MKWRCRHDFMLNFQYCANDGDIQMRFGAVENCKMVKASSLDWIGKNWNWIFFVSVVIFAHKLRKALLADVAADFYLWAKTFRSLFFLEFREFVMSFAIRGDEGKISKDWNFSPVFIKVTRAVVSLAEINWIFLKFNCWLIIGYNFMYYAILILLSVVICYAFAKIVVSSQP